MKSRKGIVLAGGSGTRLNPITQVISKQMVQVYDKPMIFYPISTLMLAGIKEILIISTPDHIKYFEKLINSMGNLGVNFSFIVQEKPNGIAAGLIIAEDFLNGAPCALILGDNIFFGNRFSSLLQDANKKKDGAQIFSYVVKNPNQYGVLKFDDKNKVISIIEKPNQFISNLAVTGLYFYNEDAPTIAKNLKPSNRNEIEITDLNLEYIKKNDLKVIKLGRGYAWLDTGSPEGLLDSANFIATIEKRQGIKISCPEEIAWRMLWITDEEFRNLPNFNSLSDYGQYLKGLLEVG
jgi:glucose-1-phosphate thymidylyltransferase